MEQEPSFSIQLNPGNRCLRKEDFNEDSLSLLSQSSILGVYDDAHGGNEGLYFLPPMVKQPSFSGTFNSKLSPIVEVSDDFSFNSLHVSFSTEGSGPRSIRVDIADELYIVNWKISDTKGQAGKIYRIRVRIGDTILGHADVGVVATGRDKVPSGIHRVVVNQTLPIKFRIEAESGDNGDPVPTSLMINPDEASVLIGGTQQFTAKVFDEDNNELSTDGITWEVSDELIATINSNGLATGVAVGFTTITAKLGALSATSVLFVQEVEGPRPGRDVVVFNDFNIFDDEAMKNPNNILLVKNLVNYSTPGIRNNAGKIWFDCGRSSRFSADGPAACGSSSRFNPLRNTIQEEGFVIEDISSTSGSIQNIPADVKVLFLWLPIIHYTVAEINTMKQFATEGGRIIFIGEHASFYTSQGLAVENQFLINMGAFMRNVGQAIDCGYNILPSSSIRPHPITAGISNLTMACASVIELGPDDFPLFYDLTNTRVLAGVASINTTPITTLETVSFVQNMMNMRMDINAQSSTGK